RAAGALRAERALAGPDQVGVVGVEREARSEDPLQDSAHPRVVDGVRPDGPQSRVSPKRRELASSGTTAATRRSNSSFNVARRAASSASAIVIQLWRSKR